jgi:hypothetical protein
MQVIKEQNKEQNKEQHKAQNKAHNKDYGSIQHRNPKYRDGESALSHQ